MEGTFSNSPYTVRFFCGGCRLCICYFLENSVRVTYRINQPFTKPYDHGLSVLITWTIVILQLHDVYDHVHTRWSGFRVMKRVYLVRVHFLGLYITLRTTKRNYHRCTRLHEKTRWDSDHPVRALHTYYYSCRRSALLRTVSHLIRSIGMTWARLSPSPRCAERWRIQNSIKMCSVF